MVFDKRHCDKKWTTASFSKKGFSSGVEVKRMRLGNNGFQFLSHHSTLGMCGFLSPPNLLMSWKISSTFDIYSIKTLGPIFCTIEQRNSCHKLVEDSHAPLTSNKWQICGEKWETHVKHLHSDPKCHTTQSTRNVKLHWSSKSLLESSHYYQSMRKVESFFHFLRCLSSRHVHGTRNLFFSLLLSSQVSMGFGDAKGNFDFYLLGWPWMIDFDQKACAFQSYAAALLS